MASVKSDISLQIKNNLNRTANFSILGGTQDPSNGQANAKTLYDWDLTAETFANTNVLTIEASTITNPTVITYEVGNQDGAITDLETVVRLLNTLNLGIFNLDGNVVWIIDDVNVFGNISILVSLSFNINVFVQEAYNYFDALGKTPLVDFQTQYTSVIQQAVDTIPDFVDFVESQGWGLCYPTNASDINLARVTAGSIFLTTDTGGVLATNEYTSGTSFNVNGFDNALLYAPDVNSFKTLQSLTFDAPLLPIVNGYIFQYLFEAPVFLSFNQNPALNNGFQFLDPSYFPSPTAFGTHNFRMPPFGTNQLNLYGSEFPKLDIQSGTYTISASQSADDIDLINVNSSIVFDTMGQDANLTLNKLIESLTSTILVDFSSLILVGDSQSIAISTTDTTKQTVTLSNEFNSIFNYGTSLKGETFRLGSVQNGGTDCDIIYNDSITPLNLGFKTVDLEQSLTTNLPPIGSGGGRMGFVNGLDYTLLLDLSSQTVPVGGFEMEYFNNWFLELGTQDFLSQTSAVTTGLFGTILTADFNTFVLSGQGISGYYALIKNGFTITTPAFAITSNLFTFTINESALCFIRTVGVGVNSPFTVSSAIKGNAEVVTASVPNIATFEDVFFPAPVGNTNNVIFTIDPIGNCSEFTVGSTTNLFDVMTTFIVGNGIFNAGIDFGIFSVSGLTITLPIYPTTTRGDAYGLFNRDFSGLNGNNITTQLTINRYKINTTDILNNLVQPYGSNALFNLAINGLTPSVGQIAFFNCQFGTDETHVVANPRPLEILLPIGTRCQNGIKLNGCSFNFDNGLFQTQAHFNLNNNAVLGIPTQQALLGNSEIINCNFDSFGLEAIILEADYSGVGDSISVLQIKNNVNINSIQLINSSTSTPPACSLELLNNALLNSLVFENYNLTNISLGTLPLVDNFQVNGNDLATVDLDAIIVALDNNGLTNGTLDYDNQTGGASPNVGVSGTAYTNLQAKGWTILGNVPV